MSDRIGQDKEMENGSGLGDGLEEGKRNWTFERRNTRGKELELQEDVCAIARGHRRRE